jgi:hypothetical protein
VVIFLFRVIPDCIALIKIICKDNLCFSQVDCLAFLEGSNNFESPAAIAETVWIQNFTRFVFLNCNFALFDESLLV